jgi:hypothetical protein
MPTTQDAGGYLKACEGLVLACKAGNDKYLYLTKMEKNKAQLKALYNEFTAQAQNPLHADYDRAYFQVLQGYVKRLEHKTAPPEHGKAAVSQKKKRR